MTERLVRHLRWLVGAALLLSGVIANPWVVERWVLIDQRLTNKVWVLVADLVLVASGALLLRASGRAGPQVRRMEPRRIAFAAVALTASAILAFAAAELVLRAAASPGFALRGDAQREVLWRDRHAVGVADGRMGYGFDEYDETLGWRPVAGYVSESVRTNAQGMRADREYSLLPTPARRRIVVVGDSFSWGEEVRNPETWEVFLERNLPDTEVLNFGVHGYGTDQQLLRLRRDALRFAPDLVIVGFYEDNLHRNVMAFRDFAKPRFVLDGEQLRLTNVPVATPEQVLARPEPRPGSYVWSLARGVVDELLDRTVWRPLPARESWHVTRAILTEARREAEASGARFLLAYFPKDVTERPDPQESLFAAWARSTATPYVSVRDRFARLPQAEWPDLYLYAGGHWTPRGNQLAAEAISAAILEQRLLSAERVVP